MPVAIIVGIDGVGKSALIELIKGHNRNSYVKAHVVVRDPNVAKDSPGSTVLAAAEQIRQWGTFSRDNRLHLYDRFPFPDEYVYGPLFGGSAIREQDLDLWDCIMESHGVKFVYIRPEGWDPETSTNLEKYCARMADDPDPHVNVHNGNVAQKILERYENIRERSSVPWLLLNYKWFTSADAQRVFKWILQPRHRDVGVLSTKAEATSEC